MTVDTSTHISQDATRHDISTSNSITTLAQGSMFWRPVFFAKSDWLEHIPFAFWLIEAHKPTIMLELGSQSGVSYFAMCQAVDRLHLETNCYAVGTWHSDSSTTQADLSGLYEAMKNHNDAHYSSFSRLITTDNQQALEYFSDHSIDLIHFNGLQGYEVGRQLINSWLPKLSDRGLILINETNVRDNNHYVHRLFEELKESNPTFDFRHGQGLGLLGVGKNQQKLIEVLFEDARNRSNTQVVRDVFSRLGRACADSYSASISKKRATKLLQEAKKLKTDLNSLEDSLSVTRQELDKKNAEMGRLLLRIDQQVETHALERGQLVERSSLIQKLYEELKSDTTTLQNAIEKTGTQLRKQDKELFQLSAEKSIKENELESLQGEIDNLRQVLSEKNQENLSLLQDIEEMSKHNETDRNSLLAQLETSKADIKIAVQNNDKTTRQLKTLTSTVETRIKKADTENEALQKENERLKNTIAARFREIATLTNLIESTKKARQNSKSEIQSRKKNKPQTTQSPKLQKGMRHEVLAYLESKKHIKLVRQSGLFDSKWYIEKYPDLTSSKKASRNPLWHYIKFGGFEGRNPSVKFVTTWYLAQNPDVAREGVNPLVHYILNGEAEGRLPKPPSYHSWS